MADETFTAEPLEAQLGRLLARLEAGGAAPGAAPGPSAPLPARAELRALALWRAVIAECLATFFYVVLVCGAAGAQGAGAPAALGPLATALAAALAATALTYCFRHISGAHMNPAVTVGMVVTRQVTPLRAGLFMAAQCGGGIAGAALLYGVTVPGYQGSLQAGLAPSAAAWERFGLEFVLTFLVVFTHCVAAERPLQPGSSLAVGAAYGACSLVSSPYLNPARALGPAFVLNRWELHWVQWAAPLAAGAAGALLHALVLGARRLPSPGTPDGDCSSVQSDEDAYDDLDKGPPRKFPQAYATYRPAPAPQPHLGNAPGLGGYCPSLTSGLYPGGGGVKAEPLYGGTRSLYCKSPTLTRANLHRSQSVYSKPPRAAPAGPLLPARDLYAHAHAHHALAQNAHNQLQAREAQHQPQHQPQAAQHQPQHAPHPAPARRPESVYGSVVTQPRRNQSAQSDDSSYGSYRGGPGAAAAPPAGAYHHHLPPPAQLQY